MPIQYPENIDSLNNPSSLSFLDDEAVRHSKQHSDVNDAVEAIETKIGVDNSIDPSSIDYRLKHGSFIRTVCTVNVPTLRNGAMYRYTLPVGKASIAVTVTTTAAAWIRVYHDLDHANNDVFRAITDDPDNDSGVLLEVLTAPGMLTVPLSPAVSLFSPTGEPSIPISIVNRSGIEQSFSVQITVITIEG